jgi:hypothetical protein
LEIRLIKLDGVVPVRLLDAGGQPVVGGVVRLRGSEPDHAATGVTDATGNAKVYAAAGEYRVYVAESTDAIDDQLATQNGNPPVRVVPGTNPALVLKLSMR